MFKGLGLKKKPKDKPSLNSRSEGNLNNGRAVESNGEKSNSEAFGHNGAYPRARTPDPPAERYLFPSCTAFRQCCRDVGLSCAHCSQTLSNPQE